MFCRCSLKLFKSESTYRRHLKTKRHELYTLRESISDNDELCQQIMNAKVTTARVASELEDAKRQIALLEEECNHLRAVVDDMNNNDGV